MKCPKCKADVAPPRISMYCPDCKGVWEMDMAFWELEAENQRLRSLWQRRLDIITLSVQQMEVSQRLDELAAIDNEARKALSGEGEQ